MGKNVIIFGADMSSSVHNDNKDKDIWILDKGLPQRLDDSTLASEAKYLINFTQQQKKGFVLSLHKSRSNSFLFVKTRKIYQFKVKDSEIKNYTLRLGNVAKDIAINNMKEKH